MCAFPMLTVFISNARDVRRRGRGWIRAGAAGVIAASCLACSRAPSTPWTPRAIGGAAIVASDRCARCHHAGGEAGDLAGAAIRRDERWIADHITAVAPPPAASKAVAGTAVIEARAVLAQGRATGSGIARPMLSADEFAGAGVYVTRCQSCHLLAGEGGPQSEGGPQAPDLSHIGLKHDAAWLERWTRDPRSIKETTEMPAFAGKLNEQDVRQVAAWLAAQR